MILDEVSKAYIKSVLLELYMQYVDKLEDDGETVKLLTDGVNFGHRNALLLVADRLGIPIHNSEHPRDLFAEVLANVSYDELEQLKEGK